MKDTDPRSYQSIFVGGSWQTSHSGRLLTSIDPAAEMPWATVPEADDHDVDSAVSAARTAMAPGSPWRKMSATERGQLLYRIAGLIRRDAEKLAYLETRDNGKPIRYTRGEVRSAASWFEYYAGAADKIQGTTIPFREGALAYTLREPVGVVAAITPWNSPISMYSWKLGPALAAGNAVILKPAEDTPVTALELASLAEEAGMPPGVLSVLPGYGEVAGHSLVVHPGVDKVAFTGETKTAMEIARSSASNLKRLSFECGGKAPHILFADADLKRAIPVATYAAFRSTGQTCTLGSRLFVQREIYETVIDGVIEHARQIRIGKPLDESTDIGPHTSSRQLTKTLSYIKAGKADGAKLLYGGSRPAAPTPGYYVEPTIFGDVDTHSALAQEEIFGPVLSVIPFESEEEVVRMANDTIYGLVGGVWTNDLTRAHRMAAALRTGLVSVNTYRPVHWMIPYGGVKLSGLGRENGLAALEEYTEVKSVVIELSDRMESFG